MGTSGAWSGTAATAWNRVRNQVDDILNDPTQTGGEGLLDPLLDAIDQDDGPTPGELTPDEAATLEEPTVAPPPAGGPSVRPRGGGRGGGGGGRGGYGGGGGRGGGGGGGDGGNYSRW